MEDSVQDKIAAFFAAYPQKTYQKGQLLVHADDNPPGVIFLKKGQVRQYDITDAGNEVVVNVFRHGSFFPMSWAINKTPNTYFFEAYSPEAVVSTAPVKDVLDFVKDNPDVMFDLLSRITSGAVGLQRRMAHLMGGSSYTRVIYELVIESKRFGKQVKKDEYHLQITEEEMASRAGLSRETVSRSIRKLKKEGLIEIKHGTIIVKKLSELELKLGSSL